MIRAALIVLLLGFPVAAEAGTKMGIITGTVSCKLRRIVVPDSDSQLESQTWTMLGESMTVVDKAGMTSDSAINGAVQSDRGCTPPSSRTAVATPITGVVTAIIHADPLLDVVSGSILVSVGLTVKVGDSVVLP